MRLDADLTLRSSLRARLERDPFDVDALVALGALEFAVFDAGEAAMEHLRLALSCDEASVPARYWLAKVLYHEPIDWHESLRVLAEAVDRDPTCPECLSLYAELLREFDRPVGEWFGYIDRALVRGGDWPVIRYQRALGLFECGKFVEAELEATEGLRLVGKMREWPPVRESYFDWYRERTIRGKGSDVIRDLLLALQERISQRTHRKDY